MIFGIMKRAEKITLDRMIGILDGLRVIRMKSSENLASVSWNKEELKGLKGREIVDLFRKHLNIKPLDIDSFECVYREDNGIHTFNISFNRYHRRTVSISGYS